MFEIKGLITKCIDDESYPSFVECQFVDIYGQTQIFHDKDAIFTNQMLDRNSNYPIDGFIGCEIIERKIVDDREVVKVNTDLPWHIESVNGETVFDVFHEQIIEFERR
jgi:hypothetical protein